MGFKDANILLLKQERYDEFPLNDPEYKLSGRLPLLRYQQVMKFT